MSLQAVITGDIIKSRRIRSPKGLLDSLRESFQLVEKQILKSNTKAFEIYRGDSFQGIIKSPEDAVLAAIIIRAKLRSSKEENRGRILTLSSLLWDARISIGVGNISYKGKRILESQGEAFTNSGENLDKMKRSGERLKITTPTSKVNEELNVSCRLADHVISKWSQVSAETALYYFLNKPTQEKMSNVFKVSQPAIHKRMLIANIEGVELFEERYAKLLTQHT